MGWLIAVLVMLLPIASIAQQIDHWRGGLYLQFAYDVSGGDPAIMVAAEGFVFAPPTTLQGIGFYGLEDATGEERALRGIISVLAENQYLTELDIQYLLEDMEPSLALAGAIGETTTVPDLLAVVPDGDWDDPAFEVLAMESLAQAIGPFARALESEAAARDRAVLQLSLPLGDSVFYWVATQEQAAFWRCSVLWSGEDVTRVGRFNEIAVTSVDWMQFYDLVRIEPRGGGAVDPALLDVPQNECARPQA